MDPIEVINQEKTTVSLDGKETEFLMRLIEIAASLNILSPSDKDIVLSIMDTFGPGIEKMAAKQIRIQRDRFN